MPEGMSMPEGMGDPFGGMTSENTEEAPEEVSGATSESEPEATSEATPEADTGAEDGETGVSGRNAREWSRSGSMPNFTGTSGNAPAAAGDNSIWLLIGSTGILAAGILVAMLFKNRI